MLIFCLQDSSFPVIQIATRRSSRTSPGRGISLIGPARLGVVEKGLGGCIIGSIGRDGLREILHMPKRYQIPLVPALGKPAERVVVEAVDSSEDIKYWRHNAGTHHVPKRPIEDLIISWGEPHSRLPCPAAFRTFLKRYIQSRLRPVTPATISEPAGERCHYEETYARTVKTPQEQDAQRGCPQSQACG